MAAAAVFAACVIPADSGPPPDEEDPYYRPDASLVDDDDDLTPIDSQPDAATTPDGAPDVETRTPICSLQVSPVGTYDSRTIYAVDLVALDVSGACPIQPGVAFPSTAPLSIGFLGGSPGHSINTRSDYQILSSTPGTLHNEGYSADAQENVFTTFTAQRRGGFNYVVNDGGFDAGDAGDGGVIAVPAPIYTIEYRMKDDPDPAKWVVEIYKFQF